jgi:hypothetical protein
MALQAKLGEEKSKSTKPARNNIKESACCKGERRKSEKET